MSEGSWNAPTNIPTTPLVVSSSLPTTPSQVGLSRRLSWNRGSNDGLPRMSFTDSPTKIQFDLPHTPGAAHDFENPFEDDDLQQTRTERVAPYNFQQPSQTSLVADFHSTNTRGVADDEQHLTGSSQAFWNDNDGSNAYVDEDEERRIGNVIKGRRQKYVGTPLRSGTLGGNALRAMQRSLRRVSVRVVDLASSGSREQGAVKLPDDSDEGSSPPLKVEETVQQPQFGELRGRTLGYFTSQSRVRIAMYNILIFRCVSLSLGYT